jgi:hypothetical protein
MYDINDTAELVASLGGDTAVAEWLGISQSAVANWKVRRSIPPGWHLRMLVRLRRDGKSINPSVFGLSASEFSELFGSHPKQQADAACAA